MEINQPSTNQNLTGPDVQPQQIGSNRKLFVTVVISVLLTSMLTGSAVYFWQKSENEKVVNDLEQKVTSLEEQISTLKKVGTAPQPTSSSAADEMMQYTDPNGRYTFRYPSSWKILDKVPEKFRATPSYVEDGDLKKWLGGKMMAETCSGPVLQNMEDRNQLIALEIVDTKSDGGFCWSSGYFMDGNKWKVVERYVYPLGSGRSYEPEWKGDYLKMEKVAESKGLTAFVALVNYETFQLKGEEALRLIISSFQFTD